MHVSDETFVFSFVATMNDSHMLHICTSGQYKVLPSTIRSEVLASMTEALVPFFFLRWKLTENF
jgi:hypothetical protein